MAALHAQVTALSLSRARAHATTLQRHTLHAPVIYSLSLSLSRAHARARARRTRTPRCIALPHRVRPASSLCVARRACTQTGVHTTVVLPALPVHLAPCFENVRPFKDVITTCAGWWDAQKAALAERSLALRRCNPPNHTHSLIACAEGGARRALARSAPVRACARARARPLMLGLRRPTASDHLDCAPLCARSASGALSTLVRVRYVDNTDGAAEGADDFEARATTDPHPHPHPQPLILTLTLTTDPHPRPHHCSSRQRSSLILTLALTTAPHPNAHRVSSWEPRLQAMNAPRYWAVDGVHPSDEGYGVWGEHIARSIMRQALL